SLRPLEGVKTFFRSEEEEEREGAEMAFQPPSPPLPRYYRDKDSKVGLSIYFFPRTQLKVALGSQIIPSPISRMKEAGNLDRCWLEGRGDSNGPNRKSVRKGGISQAPP